MHPEITHMMAMQRLNALLAEAETTRLARIAEKARRPRRRAGTCSAHVATT